MIANDRQATAFVLSMFKTNAKVRRSDLERGENVVESRRSRDKRRNISMNVEHTRYTRGKDAAKMVTFTMATGEVDIVGDPDLPRPRPRPPPLVDCFFGMVFGMIFVKRTNIQ